MSPREEADKLAAIIRAFWAARGNSPAVWVQQQHATASGTDERLHWVVRSDMLNGWPRPVPCLPARLAAEGIFESRHGLVRFSRVPRAGELIDSVRASNRVWWPEALSGDAHG